SQQYAQRSMRQAAEISPGQHIRQTAIIPQKRSLQRAAKILLLRHMPQGEISRAENCENSAAMRQAASRRNFIEIARMMNHQIPAENNKTLADSHKIPNESCRIIPAERGAAR
ncbi:hypothetical protein, partial [uncultured Campylobacter sp.]|uniref:hypothetical protein n=1 Tax=uncultured Campylobacter sp. TaxID=218934 RepID=UPI0026126411